MPHRNVTMCHLVHIADKKTATKNTFLYILCSSNKILSLTYITCICCKVLRGGHKITIWSVAPFHSKFLSARSGHRVNTFDPFSPSTHGKTKYEPTSYSVLFRPEYTLRRMCTTQTAADTIRVVWRRLDGLIQKWWATAFTQLFYFLQTCHTFNSPYVCVQPTTRTISKRDILKTIYLNDPNTAHALFLLPVRVEMTIWLTESTCYSSWVVSKIRSKWTTRSWTIHPYYSASCPLSVLSLSEYSTICYVFILFIHHIDFWLTPGDVRENDILFESIDGLCFCLCSFRKYLWPYDLKNSKKVFMIWKAKFFWTFSRGKAGGKQFPCVYSRSFVLFLE